MQVMQVMQVMLLHYASYAKKTAPVNGMNPGRKTKQRKTALETA